MKQKTVLSDVQVMQLHYFCRQIHQLEFWTKGEIVRMHLDCKGNQDLADPTELSF